MKKAYDGNNDPISFEQLVDNSVSSEDHNLSNTTADNGDGSANAPSTSDDADLIPLDLLVSSNSVSHDDVKPIESTHREPSTSVEGDRDSRGSGFNLDSSIDGFLLPGEDISSNDADQILDGDTDGLDSDSADLTSAYEAMLSNDLSPTGKIEVLVQIGTTYWKQDNDFKKAERTFRNVRNLDPTHKTMLEFYRSYTVQLPNNDVLINVLSAALNATREKSIRFELTKEIVSLACVNNRLVDRAIQLWKSFLRDHPDDIAATEELKQIFVQHHKWSNLLAFINNQIKTLSPKDVDGRKNLYREIIGTFGQLPEYENVVIESYRLLFKFEPESKEVFDRLVTFYTKHGRWKNLVDILMTRSSVVNDPEEESECLLRSATLLLEKFNNTNAAEEPLTRLIALQRHNVDAVEMLCRVYRHRREWQKLFELLDQNLKLFEGKRKLEAILEMARTATSFTIPNTNPISLWQDVFEHDPLNQEALNNLEKLCDRNENWDALVEAVDKSISAASDVKQKVSYLLRKASIHSEKRKDVNSAIEAWKNVLTLDPDHSKAFLSLKKAYFDTRDISGIEDLFIQSDDYKGLYDSLSGLVNKSKDVGEKTTLLRRCADLQLNVLNNRGKAIQLLEKILTHEPSDIDARIRLLPVYESDRQWKKFLNLLDSVLSDNADYQYQPNKIDDILVLEKQAETAQKWRVLVYLKQLRIDRLKESDPERDELALIVASIFEDKLNKHEQALVLYKQLLDSPKLKDAITSRLLKLLDQESTKTEVAELLYYEIDRVSNGLDSLKILSILLEKPPPAVELEDIKCRYNQEIELFIEKNRSDPRSLFSSLLTLLRNNHSNASIRKTLIDLADQLNRFDKLVEVMTNIYSNSNLDDKTEVAYAEAIAEIYDKKLGKADRASAYYKKLFIRFPERSDIYKKLESAYKNSKNWNGLLEIYDTALKNVKDSQERGRIAKAIIEALDRASISLEKRITYLTNIDSLEIEVESVVDRLIEAYREKADWMHLVEIVSRHLSRRARENQREKYNLILADVYYRHLNDIEEAIKRHVSVLNANPNCDVPLKFFEVLLKNEAYTSKAVEILKAIYRRRNDVASYLRVLEIELSSENSPDRERLSTLVEVALLYENHLNKIETAFGFITKAFVIDPANEEVRSRMRSYASKANLGKPYCDVIEGQIKKLRNAGDKINAVVILFEYAKYLAENGEIKKALAIYWKMIDWYADDNRIISQAIRNISSIDESNYNSEDKIKLANIELKLEKDPVNKKRILLRIANIQEKEVGSIKDAEDTYKKILKIDADNKAALQALSNIYERERRWNDLVEILKILASLETSPKSKRDILIRISKLATHM